MASEFLAHARPRAAVVESDAMVGRLKVRHVQVSPHLFPLAAAVDERLDRAGSDLLVLVDAVEEALTVFDPEPDQQVEVAAVRPVPAGHGPVEHDELDLLATFSQGGFDVAAQAVNVRAV